MTRFDQTLLIVIGTVAVTSMALAGGVYLSTTTNNDSDLKPVVSINSNVNEDVDVSANTNIIAEPVGNGRFTSGIKLTIQEDVVVNLNNGNRLIEDVSQLCGIRAYPYDFLVPITSSGNVIYAQLQIESDGPKGAIYRITLNPESCVKLSSSNHFTSQFNELFISPDGKKLAVATWEATESNIYAIDLEIDGSWKLVVVTAPETLNNYTSLGADFDLAWTDNTTIRYKVYQANLADGPNTYLRTETVAAPY